MSATAICARPIDAPASARHRHAEQLLCRRGARVMVEWAVHSYTPATISEETGCRVAEVCRVKPQHSVAAEIPGGVDGIVADQVAIASMRIEAAVARCVTSKDITPRSGLEGGDSR